MGVAPFGVVDLVHWYSAVVSMSATRPKPSRDRWTSSVVFVEFSGRRGGVPRLVDIEGRSVVLIVVVVSYWQVW